MPVSTAAELISTGRCSEMDIILDLWLSTVYNDEQVEGSEAGPVVYMRNGTGNPLVSYNELAERWGVSKATAGRILKRLSEREYISLMTFPGRHGSVIYLQSYLSTMFQISDVMIDKEEVAMILNIKLELPEKDDSTDDNILEHEICVSDDLTCVSKHHIEIVIQKMAKILFVQGISCFECPNSRYKLYPLSDDCTGEYYIRARKEYGCRFGLAILCGDRPARTFELTLSPCEKNKGEFDYGKE
uniref:MarR family transcriptional regulator n=1 Tax=Enterocloster aldenensis TaxID=358742 RepID=UPI0036F29338